MLKSTLERMKERSKSIRGNLSRLVSCLNVRPIDEETYSNLLEETWTLIGAQKADIEQVKEFSRKIEEKEMEEFRMIVAMNSLYEFKISVIKEIK